MRPPAVDVKGGINIWQREWTKRKQKEGEEGENDQTIRKQRVFRNQEDG